MPTYFRDAHGNIKMQEVKELSVLSWTDLSLGIAMGGFLMAIFWRFFKSNSIIASNDSAYNGFLLHILLILDQRSILTM